jgi:adenylate kinase
MKTIILIGPQGSGKGTQAKLIAESYHIPHISTGDLFRHIMTEKSPLGKELSGYINRGELVPNELTLNILRQRLLQDDCANGFLLDGYPRNVTQAVDLDALFTSLAIELTNVICLEIPRELVYERLEGRRTCPACGRVYHVKYNPPLVEGLCDDDGEKLEQRADDTEAAINKRLDIYYAETEPVIDYYEQQNLVANINATLDITEVFAAIIEVLARD